MEEIKFSDDVFEQIKDFYVHDLTKEQELLIDKLILNEELKNRCKEYGICKECKKPNTGYFWCQRHLQQNWTSENHEVDEFIRKVQLKAKNLDEILEWIEYDKFENVKYLAKGGFGTVFKAIWKDGFIKSWDSENNQWERNGETKVALKYLHNSQTITTEFLREVR